MSNNRNDSAKGISFLHPAFLLSTWFGIGKIPFAPGTFGSLAAFPLFIISHYLLCLTTTETAFNYIYIAFLFLLFIIGIWASNIYMRKTGKTDPGEIVIDEVVGQMLVFFAAFTAFAQSLNIFDILYGSIAEDSQTVDMASINDFFLSPAMMLNYGITVLPACALGFLLFRIFDIWKPFPIKWCDKNIKGGFGVMFDDIFAAVYASIALYALILIFFLYFVQPEAPVDPSTEIVQ